MRAEAGCSDRGFPKCSCLQLRFNHRRRHARPPREPRIRKQSGTYDRPNMWNIVRQSLSKLGLQKCATSIWVAFLRSRPPLSVFFPPTIFESMGTRLEPLPSELHQTAPKGCLQLLTHPSPVSHLKRQCSYSGEGCPLPFTATLRHFFFSSFKHGFRPSLDFSSSSSIEVFKNVFRIKYGTH